jgi:predicted metalloendopeptidase
MPDREYYLTDDARNVALRAQLQRYIARLFELAGRKDGAAAAERILQLETRIAKLHWTRVENRDPVKTYNKTSVAAAAALAPQFEWAVFLEGLGPEAAVIAEFDIRQPTYLRELAPLVQSTPVEVWREYFRYRLLDANAAFLPEAFDQARFEFRERALSGVQAQQPRWRRGLRLIDRTIGEIAGRLYVEKSFPPEASLRAVDRLAGVDGAADEGGGQAETCALQRQGGLPGQMARLLGASDPGGRLDR